MYAPIGVVPPSSPLLTSGRDVPTMVAVTMLLESLIEELPSSMFVRLILNWKVFEGQLLQATMFVMVSVGIPGAKSGDPVVAGVAPGPLVPLGTCQLIPRNGS